VRRGKPKLQSWCRACFAENNARYYQENREAQKARLLRNSAERQHENEAKMIEYLLAHACIDCGETDIIVLEFDHLRDKTKNVSALLRGTNSWSRIEAGSTNVSFAARTAIGGRPSAVANARRA